MLARTGSRELNRQRNANNVELIISLFLNEEKYGIISSF